MKEKAKAPVTMTARVKISPGWPFTGSWSSPLAPPPAWNELKPVHDLCSVLCVLQQASLAIAVLVHDDFTKELLQVACSLRHDGTFLCCRDTRIMNPLLFPFSCP